MLFSRLHLSLLYLSSSFQIRCGATFYHLDSTNMLTRPVHVSTRYKYGSPNSLTAQILPTFKIYSNSPMDPSLTHPTQASPPGTPAGSANNSPTPNRPSHPEAPIIPPLYVDNLAKEFGLRDMDLRKLRGLVNVRLNSSTSPPPSPIS